MLMFAEFTAELAKQHVKLAKKDEFELLEVFAEQQAKLRNLKQQLQQTDQAIDQMIYQLYGLTAADIALMESVYALA
jgi:uncharacterized Fe-S cluster-containing protein